MIAVVDYVNSWANVALHPLQRFYKFQGRVAFLYTGVTGGGEAPTTPLAIVAIQRGRPICLPLTNPASGLWTYPRPRQTV